MKCIECNHDLTEWEDDSKNILGIKYIFRVCQKCKAVYLPEPRLMDNKIPILHECSSDNDNV